MVKTSNRPASAYSRLLHRRDATNRHTVDADGRRAADLYRRRERERKGWQHRTNESEISTATRREMMTTEKSESGCRRTPGCSTFSSYLAVVLVAQRR